MNIKEIIIGERVRKDMGDLKSLADSIAAHGLLHPVVVKKDGTLVAGHRRIEAMRLIGFTDIPVTVIDVEDLLTAERDENTERKNFTPSEAVAIGRLIEKRVYAEVKARRDEKISAARSGRSSVNYTESRQSRDIIASAVGMGESKLTRAKAVIEAAESNSEKFSPLVAVMDSSGNVQGAYEEMKRIKRGGKPDPLFDGKRKPIKGHRIDKSAPYEASTDGQKVKANAQFKKMVGCISTMSGVCSGLNEIDLPMAFSLCEPEEKKTWLNQARNVIREVRKFATKLERI